MQNTYGRLFRLTTFGESHGAAIGVVIDGCPAGLNIDISKIEYQLSRRRPGQSAITTQRKEPDQVEIISGVFDGVTIGTPITLIIYNKDAKPKDYDHLAAAFRPSHADYTYQKKYGIRDYRGGGRASARETAARVAAGAIALQLLQAKTSIQIMAWVESIGSVKIPDNFDKFDNKDIESSIVRCPHPETALKMEEYIKTVRKAGDTVGGIIAARIQNVPVGLGEPIFDKLHAELAKAMMSINAAKGFEYGSGFAGTTLLGSQHNDLFYRKKESELGTVSNYSGGIQGGISNGEDIYFRVAFKPVATLLRKKPSFNHNFEPIELPGKGRHDPCVVPRAVPIVESMAALVIADFWLRSQLNRINQIS